MFGVNLYRRVRFAVFWDGLSQREAILFDIVGDGEPRVKPAPKGRFGSNCDLRHRLVSRLECDGEPTFGPERRLCGGDRT